MAKKNDWIHLDKTSGTGPAEVKVTADINETGEIRQVTYKVIKEGTKEEIRVQAGVRPGGDHPGVRLPCA